MKGGFGRFVFGILFVLIAGSSMFLAGKMFLFVLSPASTGARPEDGIVVEIRERIAIPRLTDAEREAHLTFIAGLGAGAIWREYVAV